MGRSRWGVLRRLFRRCWVCLLRGCHWPLPRNCHRRHRRYCFRFHCQGRCCHLLPQPRRCCADLVHYHRCRDHHHHKGRRHHCHHRHHDTFRHPRPHHHRNVKRRTCGRHRPTHPVVDFDRQK